MTFREAKPEDLIQILNVRNSVNENRLTNPDSVTLEDCLEYITTRGKGWVCEINNDIIGFSIVDMKKHNIWALFLRPEFEKKGIGKKLHDTMLDWYFKQTKTHVWLGTSPNTRAELFYRTAGWIEVGKNGDDEIKFEMTFESWDKQKKHNDV